MSHSSASPQSIASEAVEPAREERGFECDACGKWFSGEPGGSGLFIWARGEEVRYEEPPLCSECAGEIAVGALLRGEIVGASRWRPKTVPT